MKRSRITNRSQPDLYVDDHYIITGQVDGTVIIWVRQNLRMLRMFNRNKQAPHRETEEEKQSDSELAAFLGRTSSSRRLSVNSTFEQRINKIARWGDWIFAAAADCSFCVWGMSYDI